MSRMKEFLAEREETEEISRVLASGEFRGKRIHPRDCVMIAENREEVRLAVFGIVDGWEDEDGLHAGRVAQKAADEAILPLLEKYAI